MEANEKIFIIHGRDNKIYKYVHDVVCALGITPLTWEEVSSQISKATVHTLDIVRLALSQAKIIFAIFSPDEIVLLKKHHQDIREREISDSSPAEQARPNVIFEIGLAIGLANENKNKKIYVVVCDNCRLLSDIAGIDYIKLEGHNPRGFIEKLSKCLETNGFKIEVAAYKKASEIDAPNEETKTYLYDQQKISDGLAIVLKQRGDYRQYIDRIMKARMVRIMGVSQESILRHIVYCIECGGEKLKKLREIEFQLMIAGNSVYTNFIDRIENQCPRVLYKNNIRRAVDLVRLKEEKKVENLDFRMHLFANSVTMIIIDGTIWITPYTNLEGNHTPSFVIDAEENPKVYNDYVDYYNVMWEKALKVEPTYDEDALEKQLLNERERLGV